MAEDDKIIDVEIDGIKKETQKAYLIALGKRESWLPKSLVEYDKDSSTVAMPEWLAKEKGLI